ncbi:MAG: hypothetical protein JW884_01145 [Deltaproteobacteria bacterium]|nr:hypothetical protein [Deltaproteobacteria bacterium]
MNSEYMQRKKTGMPNGCMVVGSITIDHNHEGGSMTLQRGGVAIYGGLALRRHGVETTVIVNVAEEHALLLAPLHKEGVCVVSGASKMTTTFVNRVEGERRSQTLLARADPIQAEMVEKFVSDSAHFHLGPLHPEDIAGDVYEVLATAGVTVSLDIQGLVRSIEGTKVLLRGSPRLASALRCSRYIKADENEMSAACRYFSMDLTSIMKEFMIEEALVTRGGKGGYLVGSSGQAVPYNALTAGKPKATVGVGDVFFATYMAYRLHRGDCAVDSLKEAIFSAAEQTAGRFIDSRELSIDVNSLPVTKGVSRQKEGTSV